MKIGIIGAGITGLTAGKLLSKKHDVVIYEREPVMGGIARTKNVQGIAYHTVGGHCLNSNNKKIMDFIFNEVLEKSEWHQVKRDARIFFKDNLVSYPIEYSVKEIFNFDEDMALNITTDFLSSKKKEVNNLADWFELKFGRTLAKEYFIPYNRKIWGMEPSKMSYDWVAGKLPQPNKKDFFKSLVDENIDNMPHSSFFYPNSNTQNTFIEALGKGLKIINNFNVESIESKSDKWIINGEYEYDLVINTMPLNLLPFIVKNVPQYIRGEAKKLKYNKVTNMLWRTKDVKQTWTYYPSDDTIFHRHIHIGNFLYPTKNYTITESIGEHSYDEMVENGKKFKYLLEPLDYNQSDYAYIVYDQNYSTSTQAIKKYFNKIGIPSLGRFGEWEYYNMDKCIESVFNFVDKFDAKI